MTKLKFVENEEFLRLLKEYKETKNETSVQFDLKKNRETYNLIGVIFDNMAKKLLYSPKFINYTDDWKNEMYSEAVYNCCRYINSFNTVTHNNPFAYFTQVMWNSFLQVLNKEKKIKFQRNVLMERVWDEVFPNDNSVVLKEE